MGSNASFGCLHLFCLQGQGKEICKICGLLVSRHTRRRQRGRVVSASDSQSDGPGFESRSGHLLDLCSVVPSSNSRPHL